MPLHPQAYVELPPIREVSEFFPADPGREWTVTTTLEIDPAQRALARAASSGFKTRGHLADSLIESIGDAP